jgi:hypothetical protein
MELYQKHSRGISLLEVLLVFLVAAMISLLGIEHYRTVRQNEDFLIIRKNVDILLNATNNFYRKHVSDKPFPGPEGQTSHANSYKQNLKGQKENLWPSIWPDMSVTPELLPSRLVAATSTDDSSYDVTIETKTHFRITVYVDLNIANATLATAQWYANALGAANATLTTTGLIELSWSLLPSYSIPSVETNLWILNSTLEQFKQQQNNNNTTTK